MGKVDEDALQLGLEASLLLGSIEDSLELGGHHDGTLDLDLSAHEQLLAVSLALSKCNEVLVLEIDGNIRLASLDGSSVHGAISSLQVESPCGNFAISILDIELEDTLDLLDLLLALGFSETLEVLVDLDEESRRLEAVNSDRHGDRVEWSREVERELK